MKFKRCFHVFVDNFSTTYKLLLYKVIVSVIFICVAVGIAYPIIQRITSSEEYTALFENVKTFITSFLSGQLDDLAGISDTIKQNAKDIWTLITNQQTKIIVSAVILVVVYLLYAFVQGIGKYTVSFMVHDKTSMHAQTPFISTLIKTLKKSCLYNLIYVPLSFLYTVACVVLCYFLFFEWIRGFAIIRIFVFVLAIMLLYIVKATFISDWLPLMLEGKKGPGQAFVKSFSRRKKKTMGVFSNYIVISLLLLAINVMALFFTLGVGMLLTVPATSLYIICFQHVNYCDDNDLSYFLDKDTIVKPEKEKAVSREDFFKGNY